MTEEREDELHALERRVGHRFADLGLLDRALTHASLANEAAARHRADNEALEFLGDAVVGLVVTDLLHRRDPDGAEGTKSRRRARLVSAPSLSRRAAGLGLPELLLLGRGEEKTGGRGKAALWANAYEALVAALYLDGGFEAAHRFVRGRFRAGHRGARRGARGPEEPAAGAAAGSGPSGAPLRRRRGGGAEPPPSLPRRVPARRRQRHVG